MLRLIRDLFAEVVAFAEDFAADVNNVFGVGIVFSENDCRSTATLAALPAMSLTPGAPLGLQQLSQVSRHASGLIILRLRRLFFAGVSGGEEKLEL